MDGANFSLTESSYSHHKGYSLVALFGSPVYLTVRFTCYPDCIAILEPSSTKLSCTGTREKQFKLINLHFYTKRANYSGQRSGVKPILTLDTEPRYRFSCIAQHTVSISGKMLGIEEEVQPWNISLSQILFCKYLLGIWGYFPGKLMQISTACMIIC